MLQSDIERFLLSKESAMLSEATTDWYAVQLRMFAEWLASSPRGATVDTETIERYLVYLRKRPARHSGQPLSPSSVAGAHRALKIFYKWCVDREILAVSPVAPIKLKRLDRKMPRRATRQEFDALVRSLPVDGWIGLRDYLLIHTVFYCGLRIGEALRLEATHFEITEERQVLHVPGGKTGAGVVPLLREVSEAFLAYNTHRPRWRDARLFLGSDGNGGVDGILTPSGARQMLKRRCADAGLRYLNPHSFRHGIAMHLLNDKRADMSMAQRLLRHSKIGTTQESYAEWLIDPLADEYRRQMRAQSREDSER
jgi:site-specific recombinase XerD